MKMSKRLKNRLKNHGKNITSEKHENYFLQIKHPLFCFKYSHKDYNIDSLPNDEKIAFLNQLNMLSQLEWKQIQTAPKHGLGFEKIPRNQLKKEIPPRFTEDVQHLIVFRYNGKKPFLCHRFHCLLHIIFIDPKFELYDH